MDTYHGEPVLQTMACRLIPPNDLVPECDCFLMVTEESVYVLEDNFDGTYDEHYRIPIAKPFSNIDSTGENNSQVP